MLDMGFLPDIRRVLQHLPARRQTLFFSATMPPPIVALAREILRDPVTIAVERPAAPATGITHTAYPVASELKSRLLLSLLTQPGTRSVLAFTRTKHRANRLTEFLGRHGIRVERIHGNRSQAQRTQALAGFKSGLLPGAGGDGHRRARHRHRRPEPRGELRRSAAARGLHPPRGPDRARGGARGRAHAGRAERGGRPPDHRAGHRRPGFLGRSSRISTTTSGSPSASRSPLPSRLADDARPAGGPASRRRAGQAARRHAGWPLG